MAVNYDSWLTSPTAWEERYYGYADEDEDESDDYDEYDAHKEEIMAKKLGYEI